METFILVLIAFSFIGFIISLVYKNINNDKKKSFRYEEFFKYLGAASVIALLALAFLYKILFT
ncbi:MAG: hypothetical protein WCO63_11835 [Bacteroidota bacterium]